jgi:hypothetical protein
VRYSYVEPAREPPPWQAKPYAPAVVQVVLKRASLVEASDPVVPAGARSLLAAAREARPSWTFALTHSVTLNEAGNALVHHVFLRVFNRHGEPLGHCGWTAGHTSGARIWNHHPDQPIPWAFVNATEFACWVKNVPYEPPAVVERARCPRCTALDVRIKLDGSPYKHRDPLMGMECA